jgi:hypothetical protein
MSSAAVIPVRNRPSLIAAAIASVQAQTLPLDEIIVVDDGSTDDTPEVVERLSKIDSRITLVRIPKSGGAASARNLGIKAARSRWICFLDSDDSWMAEKHEWQSKKLAEVPEAIASFTGVRCRWPNRELDMLAPVGITLTDLRQLNYLNTTTTAMVRRDVLEKIGSFDPQLPSCQDWDLWIKLRKIGEFAIVPEPLVIFNQAETVRISFNKKNVLTGHSVVFQRALQDVSDAAERRTISAYHQIRLTEIFVQFEQPFAAITAALKSLFYRPTTRGRKVLWLAVKSIKSLFIRK